MEKSCLLLLLSINLTACGLDAVSSASTNVRLKNEEVKQAQKQLDTIKIKIKAAEGAAARTKYINSAINSAE